ncbi:MAG: hypothetical protein RQ745_03570, partial [Longimicrobiales bacterium]|nr:hypothetical protein [Longimicrobiales bacterium]
DIYQSDLLGFNVGFTNATLDSEVLDLGGVGDIIFNRGLQRHAEGFDAGGFHQGVVSFTDPNGDGLLRCDSEQCDVSVGETEFLGPSQPEHNRTVFADVRVFDWITISTLFEGRGGHLTATDSEAFRCGFNSTRGCRAVADPTASLEDQAAFIADRFLGSAEGFVEDGTFWRWREFSVAFDMPSLVTNSLSQLDGLRLTLSGRNLKTFTNFSGIDPETVEGGGSANFSQSEFNTQPPVRQFMIRLDYRF